MRYQAIPQGATKSLHQNHAQNGLGRFENGLLLTQAQKAGFEVLLTVDQNLRYQQNHSGRAIAVVVLIATGITVEDLLPLVPALENALIHIQPGHVYEVR